MPSKKILVSLIAFIFAGVLAITGCGSIKAVNAHDGIGPHDSTAPQAVAWGGIFTVTDVGEEGQVKWTQQVHNTVMTVGKNHTLETEFRGGTAVTTWYIGLISSSGYSAISAADTLASHAGWTEGTPYSGNRPAWTPGAASGGVTTNGSAIAFTINATLTVKGMFLASANTGTTGTLMSAALFSGGDASVISGDTLNVTYTFTLTLLDAPTGFPFLGSVRLMNPRLFARKEQDFARVG